MRERHGPRMVRMREFHATCHNTEDVYEALGRAQSLFDGERPFSRTLHVTFTAEETGSWEWAETFISWHSQPMVPDGVEFTWCELLGAPVDTFVHDEDMFRKGPKFANNWIQVIGMLLKDV
jgi:hypothetical protein